MQQLLEDIKSGQFKQAYLLYGEEAYLRLQYRDRVKKALSDPADSMNFHRFEGKNTDPAKLIDLAETMPFFAPRRVILVEDSGFFQKGAEQLADYLKNPAPTAMFLFVETQVDKRSRMFKAVRETGRAVEFATQTEETLKKWILGQIRREGKKISEETLNRFLTMTGTDMEQISSELEKLFCYTLNRDVITREDVDAVCVRQISSRIFEMVESMALRRQQQTLKLYYDLLSLKEPPMRILYLIGRQFNLLLQVKALKKTGSDDRTIAEKTGLRGFLVKKYASQASRFSRRELQEALAACAEADESVKTGRMGDRMCVELLLIRYSAEKTKGRSQTWET